MSGITQTQVIEAYFLIVLSLVFMYFKRRMVKIYNFGYEGEIWRVGTGFVKIGREGLCISLSKRIVKKSRTDKFFFVFDDFMTGRNYEEDIIIRWGKHSIFVPFEDETEVSLPCIFGP